MLAGVAVVVPRWPIVGRLPELEIFEQILGSGQHAGLVIHGRAGVGKTRLADECRARAKASGHPTERVTGSRNTALLPLGAVATLLAGGLDRADPDGQVDAVALFEYTRVALRQRHLGRRLVTVADDVALLDAASLALLGYLAAQEAIFLIATVRTGEPVPDLLTSLWREGRMERVDLGDLSRAEQDTLLHLVLGGPVEAGAAREFWEVTQGNPLCVRELVPGALESGALVERSGVWHLEDRLPATSRLLDLVEQRIGGLSAEARSVVELLALCQPLELRYLEETAPLGVLESLERTGLVTIAVAEGEVRLAHPLRRGGGTGRGQSLRRPAAPGPGGPGPGACPAGRGRRGRPGAGRARHPAGVRLPRTRAPARRRVDRPGLGEAGADRAAAAGRRRARRVDRAPDHRVVALARPDADPRGGHVRPAARTGRRV
jgi:hypothetical protein